LVDKQNNLESIENINKYKNKAKDNENKNNKSNTKINRISLKSEKIPKFKGNSQNKKFLEINTNITEEDIKNNSNKNNNPIIEPISNGIVSVNRKFSFDFCKVEKEKQKNSEEHEKIGCVSERRSLNNLVENDRVNFDENCKLLKFIF